MSAADVKAVESFFQRLTAGGVDAVARDLHPDFEFTTPQGLASEPDTYRGEAGLRRWFDSFYDAMDKVEIAPTEFVDLGDGRVAGAFRLLARGRATSLELSQDAAMLIELVGATARRCEIVETLPAALALAEAEETR